MSQPLPPDSRPDPTPDPELHGGVWTGFLDAQPRIRVVARCLFRRPADGAWLVVRAFDHIKNEAFFVPPGGGMRFGERAEETLDREMHEEFGCGVTNLRSIAVLQNHFTHRGVPGHEVVFIFTGDLRDASLALRDTIEIEDGGEHLTAAWLPATSFRSGTRPDLPPLYPDGAAEIIRELDESSPAPTAR